MLLLLMLLPLLFNRTRNTTDQPATRSDAHITATLTLLLVIEHGLKRCLCLLMLIIRLRFSIWLREFVPHDGEPVVTGLIDGVGDLNQEKKITSK